MNDYTQHRLYSEFLDLRKEDYSFAALYSDTEEDFYSWAMDHEVDSDWVSKTA
jgi:hypothetical protein